LVGAILAIALTDKGQFTEAEDALQSVHPDVARQWGAGGVHAQALLTVLSRRGTDAIASIEMSPSQGPRSEFPYVGLGIAELGWSALARGDLGAAKARSSTLSEAVHLKLDGLGALRASLLSAAVSARLGENERSGALLHKALHEARSKGLREQEIIARLELARWAQGHGDASSAMSHAEVARRLADECHLRLRCADALNVLSLIASAQGNRDAALHLAKAALGLSECDGEPYTYARGIREAHVTFAAHGVDVAQTLGGLREDERDDIGERE
jgi:hypothetical protein